MKRQGWANKYLLIGLFHSASGIYVFTSLTHLSSGQQMFLWMCTVAASHIIMKAWVADSRRVSRTKRHQTTSVLPLAVNRQVRDERRDRGVHRQTMSRETHAVNMKRYVAWCEQRIKQLVIQEKLHLGLVKVVQGPLTITFLVRMVRPSKQRLQKLLGLGPAIAQSLQAESVRITDSAQGVLIELPSPLPKTPNAMHLVQHTRGLQVPVGMDQWRQPVTVDLHDHGAVFWIGPSRRGKTQAMKSALYCLLAANPNLQFLILVPVRKRADWEAYSQVAGCVGIACTPDEVSQALEWMRGLLNSENPITGQYLILVDDLINLQRTSGDLSEYLEELASMGAGLGFHLLVGTQAAGSKATSGGSAVEANVSARILFKPSTSQQGARSAGQGGLDTSALTSAKGDALLLEHGFATRIATPWVDDLDIVQLPAGRPLHPWMDMAVDTSPSYPEQDIQPTSSHIHSPQGMSRNIRISPPSHLPQSAAANIAATYVTGDGSGGYGGYEVEFPIGNARPLTKAEQDAVRHLARDEQFWHRGNLSIRRITVHVYGSRNPQREEWIKQALAADSGDMEFGNSEAPATSSDSSKIDLKTKAGRQQWAQLLQSGDINWSATREQYQDRRLME